MRLLADEHVWKEVIGHLRQRGHDIVSVASTMSGATDQEIFAFAKEDDRIILTLDADFGNVLRFPLFTHAGILLVRARRIDPVTLCRLLDQTLDRLAGEDITGKLVVLGHRNLRLYPKV